MATKSCLVKDVRTKIQEYKGHICIPDLRPAVQNLNGHS